MQWPSMSTTGWPSRSRDLGRGRASSRRAHRVLMYAHYAGLDKHRRAVSRASTSPRLRRERVGQAAGRRCAEQALDASAAARNRQRDLRERRAATCWPTTTGATTTASSVLVVAGDDQPHLFTSYPTACRPTSRRTTCIPPLYAETEAGVDGDGRGTVRELTGGTAARIGIDDYTAPMWFHLPAAARPGRARRRRPAAHRRARASRRADEQECMRRSWEINEAAHVRGRADPAARHPRSPILSGVFLRRLFELGATCNFLDPVFQAMPERIADGPWSTNNDVPFNLITDRPHRQRRRRDLDRHGDGLRGLRLRRRPHVGRRARSSPHAARPPRALAGDHRRGDRPSCKPGVTGDVLTRIAIELNGGTKPWLDHFFLGARARPRRAASRSRSAPTAAGVRREVRARTGHGDRDRTGHVARRARGLALRGARVHHRRRPRAREQLPRTKAVA